MALVDVMMWGRQQAMLPACERDECRQRLRDTYGHPKLIGIPPRLSYCLHCHLCSARIYMPERCWHPDHEVGCPPREWEATLMALLWAETFAKYHPEGIPDAAWRFARAIANADESIEDEQDLMAAVIAHEEDWRT